MRIRKIEIRNYGSLHHKTYEIHPEVNELPSGKEGAEVLSFLRTMLYGKDSPQTWGCEGTLWFQRGGEDFRLTRKFDEEQPYHELVSETSGAITDASKGSLERVLGSLGEVVFDQVVCITGPHSADPKETVREIQTDFAGYMESMDPALDLGRASQVLKMTRKGYQVQEEHRQKELNQREQELIPGISKSADRLEQARAIRGELEESQSALKFGKNGGRILEERVREAKSRRKNGLLFLEGAALFLAVTAGIVRAVSGERSGVILALVLGAVLFFLLGIWDYEKTSKEIKKRERLKRKWMARQKRLSGQQNAAAEDFEENARAYSNLKAEYREYEEEKQRVTPEQEEVQAISEALQRIQNLSERNVMTRARRLEERTTKIAEEISGMPNRKISLDTNQRLIVEENNERVVPERLPEETLRLIYFALHLAAGEIAAERAEQMYILTDVWNQFSEGQRRQILEWMKKENKQFLLYESR